MRYGKRRTRAMVDDTRLVAERLEDEYRKGCFWACSALVGMFAVLSAGAAVLGW